METIKVIFWGLVLVLCSQVTSAQESFYVKPSRDTVKMGNIINVTFTVENVQGEFEAPKFSKFNQLGGVSLSSSISILNGKMSQSQSYTFTLEPVEEGLQVIEPAMLHTSEETLLTDPLHIVVLPNPDGSMDQLSKRRRPSYEREFQESPKPKSTRPITRL